MTSPVHRVLRSRVLACCPKGIAAILSLLLAGLGVMGTVRAQPASGGDAERSSEAVEWRPFEEALAVADTSGRPVLVHVEAPWCGWCRKMNREVFPELGSYLNARLVATRINREERSTTHRYREARYTEAELARRFNASGVPTVVLLDPAGNYLFHLSGYHPASDLRPVFAYVAEGAYRSQSLRSYLRTQ
jgi:thioredoxin-related protein